MRTSPRHGSGGPFVGYSGSVEVSDVTVRYSELAKTPDFARWLTSRTFSVAGTEGTAAILPILVYQTTGSIALTGAIGAFTSLPYLLFGLVAGAYADRARRKRLMICSELLGAVALVSVPAAQLLGTPTIAHIALTTFAVWTAFAWFDSAAWGAIVRIVPKTQLAEANSLIWSLGIAAAVLMPTVSTVIASATDPVVVLAINSVTYVISASVISRIKTELGALPADASDNNPGPSIRQSIREGLSYLWHSVELRLLTISAVGLTFSSGAVIGMTVIFATQALGFPEDDWRIGLLFTAAAIGALLSTLALPKLNHALGAGRTSVLAYFAYSLTIVMVALSPAWPVALVLWAIWFSTNSLAVTNGITIRQYLAPDDLQGRINTTARMIGLGGTPLGALVGGLLAEQIGVRALYLLTALPTLIAAIALSRSRLSTLRLTEQ